MLNDHLLCDADGKKTKLPVVGPRVGSTVAGLGSAVSLSATLPAAGGAGSSAAVVGRDQRRLNALRMLMS
jgi:hypothetical protein